MIEKQLIRLGPDQHKASLLAVHEDVPAERGIERRQKALAGTRGIETADAFETLAHGIDAELHQRVDLVASGMGKRHVQRCMLPG
jgi:hypothetical protein